MLANYMAARLAIGKLNEQLLNRKEKSTEEAERESRREDAVAHCKSTSTLFQIEFIKHIFLAFKTGVYVLDKRIKSKFFPPDKWPLQRL